eukprot:g12105.t1
MVMLLLISQYMMILVVNGKRGKDVTCKAGEGIVPMFTSGSQCSGVSKITTAAECKLAAEYNRKNNIHGNAGYDPRRTSWSWAPPGCIYYSGRVYLWNYNTKSTAKCNTGGYKCVCKPKTCTKCPINTYSEGGINPTYEVTNSIIGRRRRMLQKSRAPPT